MHPALSIPFIGMNECIHEEYSKKGLATSRRSVKSANNAGLCALCQMIPGIGEGKQELYMEANMRFGMAVAEAWVKEGFPQNN